MTIRHILKDGTVLENVSGHIVKMKDAKALYDLMDRINENANRKGDK